MAPPLPAAPKRTRPRRLNLPLLSSSSVAMNMPAQARMAAGPQATSPSLAPAPQATLGSIPPTATWLPPAFVPNSSSPMVHSSDLNATNTAIQEGCCPAPYALFEAPQPWLAKDKSSPSASKQDTNSSLGSQASSRQRESDEQVMDKAMAFYEADLEEGQFKLIACWKILRDQPKWHAYNEDLNGSSKRKSSESEAVDLTSSPNVVNNLPRP
ncbi:hypothetical protein HU200_014696 [Digitaria exilis]|uniref:No apical meristem-associated C-terminal domain-containing protein n=1 Tax=Digitaria exilis TaxID=1010633 RepID=A0A835KLD6_9POAL|nr:hypothetical protein HU200_014696 [Digitaria exilis]